MTDNEPEDEPKRIKSVEVGLPGPVLPGPLEIVRSHGLPPLVVPEFSRVTVHVTFEDGTAKTLRDFMFEHDGQHVTVTQLSWWTGVTMWTGTGVPDKPGGRF
ncbi:hypothetical protein ACIGO9_36005 [Nocardia asteroides]|uniref:hypothetical protein n=1 Tax=Nocardia asteroides TaxID=1824 RepID=UPI0037C99474